MTTQFKYNLSEPNGFSVPTEEHRARFAHTDSALNQWLTERQELLILFNRLGGAKPFQENPLKMETLQGFCEILVDYLSRGHFQIFEKIAKTKEIYNPLDPELDKDLA